MANSKKSTYTCLRCGTVFIGGTNSQYCPECKIERRREYVRGYLRQKREIAKDLAPTPGTYTCIDCGAVLPIPNNHTPKRCPDCAKERQKERKREHANRVNAENRARAKRIMRGKAPAVSFSDIHAKQQAAKATTGRYHTYGQIAAEPYLAKQAAEMEERRRQHGF